MAGRDRRSLAGGPVGRLQAHGKRTRCRDRGVVPATTEIRMILRLLNVLTFRACRIAAALALLIMLLVKKSRPATGASRRAI